MKGKRIFANSNIIKIIIDAICRIMKCSGYVKNTNNG